MSTQDEWAEGFRDRLSEALRRANMNQRQLALALDVDEGTVSKWATKVVPRTRTIARIADATKVSPDWLLGAAPVVPRDPPAAPAKGEDWHQIPKVAFAAAGQPVDRLPDDVTWYAFHRSWVIRHWGAKAADDRDRLVVVQVEKKTLGESMLPTIRPGAILVIDRGPKGQGIASNEVQTGAIYLVKPDDEGGLAVKRVFVDGSTVVLTSDNPDRRRYPPRTIPLREKRLHQLLIGRVRWIGQEED